MKEYFYWKNIWISFDYPCWKLGKKRTQYDEINKKGLTMDPYVRLLWKSVGNSRKCDLWECNWLSEVSFIMQSRERSDRDCMLKLTEDKLRSQKSWREFPWFFFTIAVRMVIVSQNLENLSENYILN